MHKPRGSLYHHLLAKLRLFAPNQLIETQLICIIFFYFFPPFFCDISKVAFKLVWHCWMETQPLFFSPSADGWDGGRNNFVNGYHDNRMTAGNSFNRGPPRMERGRGGVGGGYRGNRGGSFNPINPAQPMGFVGYETKGWDWVYQQAFHARWPYSQF